MGAVCGKICAGRRGDDDGVGIVTVEQPIRTPVASVCDPIEVRFPWTVTHGNAALDGLDEGLSDVAKAAFDALKDNHAEWHQKCWNVTYGRMCREIQQTPPAQYWNNQRRLIEDDTDCHSSCLPNKMLSVIVRAEKWVDISSLSAPDGLFLEKFQEAMKVLGASGKEITIRMLFGNIVGMPTDCEKLVEQLTEGMPATSKVTLWVGAWRRGLSWNHSKIIAVDGRYLFHGGHNLWDPHYLKINPVHDLSMESEGAVAIDGHVFVNTMWEFIIQKDKGYKIVKHLPDWVPLPLKDRVSVSQWPKTESEYPPMYEPVYPKLSAAQSVLSWPGLPIITCGRYGALHPNPKTANPSDSAITAMLGAAQKVIRMSLQDLGPIMLPGTTRSIPGGTWPKQYLAELGRAIFERGVDVEIVLSNPNACPGQLNPMTANYGNGWSCVDVAAEIVKAARDYDRADGEADDAKLRAMIHDNLRITFLRVDKGVKEFPSSVQIGNHAKFFIVDDKTFYIGSQNLYIANLAEWGTIIDSAATTKKVIEQYWEPMWKNSYLGTDVDVAQVMDGLDVNRDGCDESHASPQDMALALRASRACVTGRGTDNTLVVWVKRAANVKNMDGPFGGSSDSYVNLRLVDDDRHLIAGPYKTSVMDNGGANPEWNEEIVFEGLLDPMLLKLQVSVLDQDTAFGLHGKVADMLARDDKIGSATVDLGLLKKSGEWQDMELTVDGGRSTTLSVSFNTRGGWGK